VTATTATAAPPLPRFTEGTIGRLTDTLPDVLACLANTIVTDTPRPLLTRPQWATSAGASEAWLEEVAGARTERARLYLDYAVRDRKSLACRTWRKVRAAQRELGLTADPRIETPEPVGPPIALI
jgi:hypothetical protein